MLGLQAFRGGHVRFVCAVAAFAFFVSAAAAQPSQPPARRGVLILNSYDQWYEWTADLTKHVDAELARQFTDLDVWVEYLDARRFGGDEHLSAMRDLLLRKYSGRKIDLIVSTDDAALKFLLDEGPGFLGGPPVVFGGVGGEELIRSVDRKRYTGVRERFSHAALLDLLLRLRPKTRHVAVIVDASTNAKSYENGFVEAIRARKGLTLELLRGQELYLDEIVDKVGELPPESAVLSMGFVVDLSGTHHPPDEAMRLIAGASKGPIFSPNISTLGQGVVCGNTNGAAHHAALMARKAVSILKGARPEQVKVDTDMALGPMFDYNAMKRWGIDEDLLPEGSVVVNKPADPLGPIRPWLAGFVLFVLVQSVIIGLLVANIVARRKAVAERDAHAVHVEARNAELDEVNRSLQREFDARESAELALRESERRYRETVENARDGMFTHDLNGRFIAANRALCDLLGYSREQLFSMNIEDVLEEESAARSREATASKLAGDTTAPFEVCARTAAGRRVWLEISSRLQWSNGFPAGVEGIARDITSRMVLEEQLRQAQKMEALGRLAGGVAHDFNNILTVVTGYSDLLLLSLPEEHEARPRVEEIRKAGERAADLTRKLLDFGRSRAQANMSGDVNKVLTQSGEMLRYLVPPSIELSVIQARGTAYVRCDESEIQQIVLNLALNARDAMPDGGSLTLRTRFKGASVLLTVTDNGMGMDDYARSMVFEPFFTTKEPGRGTGLGLSTVYGIVRRAGGNIEVSSAPGRGTTFNVRLPLASAPAAIADAAKPETRQGTGELIFVVEDQTEVRRYVDQALGQLGYRLKSFESATGVVESLTTEVSLLITDIVMPKVTGPELVRQCRVQRPELPVLYMSGYPGPGQQPPPDGHFLAKPFSPGDLARAVRTALDHRKS